MQYFVHMPCAIRHRSMLLSLFLVLSVFGQTSLAQEDKTVGQTEPRSSQVHSQEAANATSPTEDKNESTDAGGSISTNPDANPIDWEKWRRRYRRYNTWEGSTGGIHLVDPLSGAAGSIRIQVGIRGFGVSDFLVEDDNVESIAQRLSVSWTPTEYLELYGSLSNRSVSVDQSDYETRREDPRFEEVFHSNGDASLGLKAGALVTPLLSLAGDVSVLLPNQPATIGIQLDAVSISVRGDLSADLRYLKGPLPFIGRFNMDYRFDHSELLIKDTEDKRYENTYLDDPNPPSRQKDPDHLISRVERFGMDINRVDLFTLGLGFEIPLQVAEEFYLHPIMEWRMSFPVNRRDFVCPYRSAPEEPEATSQESNYPDEKCGDREGADAFPSTLGFGIRGITPIRGVSAILGIDIGLTGTSTFIRELRPTAPYEILFAVSYDYDARPPEVRIVERKVPVEPTKGRIVGLVTQTGAPAIPIPGAMIVFTGTELSPIAAGDDGRFRSYDFVPGKVEMSVSHPDFQSSTCDAEIPSTGGDIEVVCPLVQLPRTGEIKGAVTDIWNNGVASAIIEISGAGRHTVTTDHDGRFRWPVEPGEYTLRIDAAGYFIRIATVVVKPRELVSRGFILAKKPARSSVTLKGDSILIGSRLSFDKSTGQLSDKSILIVSEVADLILRNPQIRKIRVFGSTSRAASDTMVALARALGIKHALVNAGVAPERIEAVGGDRRRVRITVERD